MFQKQFFLLLISTYYCLPKNHQREIVEELRRIENPIIYDSNEKLNKKMKTDPYPEDLIDCQLFSVCGLCAEQEGYQITNQNNHLIGLHFNYKQEIKQLYDLLSHFVNQQRLYYSFSKKGICIESQNIDQSLSNIMSILNVTYSNQLPFPQLVQRQGNITLRSVILFAHYHNYWGFEIHLLNYTGGCISNFFYCKEFQEIPYNNSISIKGFGNGSPFQISQKQYENTLQIEQIKLPNQFFNNLIRMFFGDRFIEQIEHDQDQDYKIKIIEKNEEGNHELILVLEVI